MNNICKQLLLLKTINTKVLSNRTSIFQEIYPARISSVQNTELCSANKDLRKLKPPKTKKYHLKKNTMQTKTNNINQILSQIEYLSYDEKIEVMDRIIRSFKKQNSSAREGLTRLKGLGKGLWNNINVDEYIDSQRKTWD